MNKSKQLRERFFKDITPKGAPKKTPATPIYENPSTRELYVVAGGYRGEIHFVADPHMKKVYVWSASSDVYPILSALNLYLNDPNLLIGTVAFQRNKWQMIGSDHLKKMSHTASITLRKDWKWVDNYFNVSSFLDTIESGKVAVHTDVAPEVMKSRLLWSKRKLS